MFRLPAISSTRKTQQLTKIRALLELPEQRNIAMKALLYPDPLISPVPITKNRPFLNPQTSVRIPIKRVDYWVGKSSYSAINAVLDSASIDELRLQEPDIKNPALSTSYRNSELPKPNQTVLEAQTKVCTGPTQTRPLTEEQAFKVLDTILKSGYSDLTLSL